jgi:hypothetical protein
MSMPLYYLYTRAEGVSTWSYTGYQLSIAGNSNGALQVQARTYPKTQPPNPGQWNTVTGASRSGNGNPDNPSNGDDMGLPATIGNVNGIEGDGTYNSTGDSTLGAGYYTSEGPVGDEGDWCATTN